MGVGRFINKWFWARWVWDIISIAQPLSVHESSHIKWLGILETDHHFYCALSICSHHILKWLFCKQRTRELIENNSPIRFGMMCVWPGMPNKSVFDGFYQWLKKRIHIARQYRSRCNIDSFLLNKKGLEEVSILHKNFCNMHIARRNIHIAIESIASNI